MEVILMSSIEMYRPYVLCIVVTKLVSWPEDNEARLPVVTYTVVSRLFDRSKKMVENIGQQYISVNCCTKLVSALVLILL